MIDRKDGTYVFRLHKDRVYYVQEELLKSAIKASRDEIMSVGTCFGKFTKTMKFRLHVTCLDYLAQFAQYKVWVKSSSEMSFMYGNHILKTGLGKITDNTPKYQGVVIVTMSNVPIGFGVTASSTQDCRALDPTGIVAFNQADVGEYLRHEDSII